jgi:hypothetical protein
MIPLQQLEPVLTAGGPRPHRLYALLATMGISRDRLDREHKLTIIPEIEETDLALNSSEVSRVVRNVMQSIRSP